MKKFTVITAVTLILTFCLTGCSSLNNIIGYLESLEEMFTLDTSEVHNTGILDAVETDEAGHTVKLRHYDGEGKLIFTHVTTWENDRIKNKTSYDGKGTQTGSIDYEYDERGNNTVMSWFFWNSGRLMRVERVYDEYDRMTESTGFGTETVSTNKTYFEYDDKDGQHPKNYCKKTYYPSYPGDRYSVSTLEYDGDGKLTKMTTVNQDGDLVGYDVYTYENGVASGYTDYNADGKINYSYKYIYDENGKKIREERYDGEGRLEGVDY